MGQQNSWYLQSYEEHHWSNIQSGIKCLFCSLGFTKPLSVMLQVTSLDIIKAYTSIKLIQNQLMTLWTEYAKEFVESVWRKASEMAAIPDTELILPKICRRMTNRSNILGKSAQEYYKVTLFIPIIDHLVAEPDLRFSQIHVRAVCGMYLIPKNIVGMTNEHRDITFKFFKWALPSPQTFN